MTHRTVICVLLFSAMLVTACGEPRRDGDTPRAILLTPTAEPAVNLAPPTPAAESPPEVAEPAATLELAPTAEPAATPEPAAPAPSTSIGYELTQKKTPTTLEGHPNLAPSDKTKHSPAPQSVTAADTSDGEVKQDNTSSSTKPIVPRTYTPRSRIVEAHTIRYNAEPIEERILKSSLIVRAELELVRLTTRAFEDFGTAYVGALEMQFRVLETLKGTAGGRFIWVEVVVIPRSTAGSPFHAMTSNALDVLTAWDNTERDTRWADREVILFLKPVSKSTWKFTSGRSSIVQYVLTGSLTEAAQIVGDDWITNTSLAVAETPGSSSFLLEEPLEFGLSEIETVPLSDIKTTIATTEAMVDATIEGYRECLIRKFRRERLTNRITRNSEIPKSVHSGQPANSIIEEYRSAVKGRTLYLSGKDVGLFEHTASTDEDGFPYLVFKQRRPLPMGTYHFLVRARDAIDMPCGNHPQYGLRWMITATPPTGTLHEMFFDPENVGTTVGVLKPTSFTDANGGSATIGSISYVHPPSMGSGQAGTVNVKVTPDDALDDHIVDIIELDGTVSLSLDVVDATVDSANDTLSWSVASQPWEDGDKLMVRIREAR